MNTHSLEEQLLLEAKLSPRYQLRRALGEFFDQWPWEWFVTLTFSEKTGEERAKKLFRTWSSMLSRDIYGPRWHKRESRGVTFIVAVERHKSGNIHLHALLAGVGDTRRLTWMDNWENLDRIAGYSRIYAVQNNAAVTRYVTKYVVKGGEFVISENLGLESRALFDRVPSPESEA